MSERQFLKRWLKTLALIQNSFLSLFLREVPSSSLNIQESKDGNADLCRLTHDTHVKMSDRK